MSFKENLYLDRYIWLEIGKFLYKTNKKELGSHKFIILLTNTHF